MLLTPHLVTMSYIATFMEPNALTVILGTIVSYFIIELIPHWDPKNFESTWVTYFRLFDLLFGSAYLVLLLFIVFSQPNGFILLNKQITIGFYSFLASIVTLIMWVFFNIFRQYIPKNTLPRQIADFFAGIKYEDKSFWGITIQFSITFLSFVFLFGIAQPPDFSNIVRILTLP